MEQRQITILGSGPKWETYPQDRETWAVGKMVMLVEPPKRADRLFSLDAIDDMKIIKRGAFTREAFVKAINDRHVPFYTSVPEAEIPLALEYPLKEVFEKFKVPYLSNTICYMIALALYEGATELNLYGIAQMGTHEYVAERAAVEFWLGMAMGMGVAVNIETPSLLLRNNSEYPYGYMRTVKQLQEAGKL